MASSASQVPASGETEFYNVYRVYFTQRNAPPHQAIALVPAEASNQTKGRFYHVYGLVGMGMTFEIRANYDFGKTRGYRGAEYQFQLPASYLAEFEKVAADRPPPYDPRALFGSKPDPPVRDCSGWTTEVLEETKAFAQAPGQQA